MDGQKLARWKRKLDTVSVLNLRGQNDGEDWCETERAVTDRLAVKHVDFRMSASTELTDKEVHALLDVMRKAPKPMLIHC
jgi:protein tyrosine/serine phosphatase